MKQLLYTEQETVYCVKLPSGEIIEEHDNIEDAETAMREYHAENDVYGDPLEAFVEPEQRTREYEHEATPSYEELRLREIDGSG